LGSGIGWVWLRMLSNNKWKKFFSFPPNMISRIRKLNGKERHSRRGKEMGIKWDCSESIWVFLTFWSILLILSK
jgi:hypothetical protein